MSRKKQTSLFSAPSKAMVESKGTSGISATNIMKKVAKYNNCVTGINI